MAMLEKTLNSENSFSDTVLVKGQFNFSLLSTDFNGKVTIQRRYNDQDTWRVVNKFAGSFEGWDFQPGRMHYRFGIKTGDYISGSIAGKLTDVTT